MELSYGSVVFLFGVFLSLFQIKYHNQLIVAPFNYFFFLGAYLTA